MTTLAGLAIALVVGVLLALLVVYVEAVKSVIMPFLAAFNSIPKIAIAPLFVIWFGLGAESKILLAFLLALYQIDRKSTRLNSSHMSISYAVFCLKKKR